VSFQVVSKDVKGTNNGKKFFVMDFIVMFCREEGLGMVSNRVPMVQGIGLF